MRLLIFIFLEFVFVLINANPLKADDSLVISGNEREYIFGEMSPFLKGIEDTSGRLSLEDVRNKNLTFFKQNKNFRKKNDTPYWGVLTIINTAPIEKNYLLEFFDQAIDSLDVYIPDNNGIYKKHESGEDRVFSEKEIEHKNFVFRLPSLRNKSYKVYFRTRSSAEYSSFVAVREDMYFAEYAMKEYYYFGILYGLVLFMAFYNMSMFFAIKDKTYLFYVIYVMSFLFYTLASNGTGYQFFWGSCPGFNSIAPDIFKFLLVVFALIYSVSFLNIDRASRSMKLVAGVVVFRTLVFLGILFFDFPDFTNYLDPACLLVVYIMGIIAFKKGYKPARFFVLGFSILYTGFTISSLFSPDIVKLSYFQIILLVYSFEISTVAEMMFFSIALSDKVRNLAKEKETMQRTLNVELEAKVEQRTTELDTFVYRVSHDLKGPLRSITGITKLGLSDTSRSEEYFTYIQQTTSHLEKLVSQFLTISKTKQGVIQSDNIDFCMMMESIISSLRHSEIFKNVSVKLLIEQKYEFLSDPDLIASILQNLLENALKYRKEGRINHSVSVFIKVNPIFALIQVEDNGRGIKKGAAKKVFDMFHRENVDVKGSGLGLYIVKTTIEKLGGKITLESLEGQGTVFSVSLPNNGKVEAINKYIEVELNDSYSQF